MNYKYSTRMDTTSIEGGDRLSQPRMCEVDARTIYKSDGGKDATPIPVPGKLSPPVRGVKLGRQQTDVLWRETQRVLARSGEDSFSLSRANELAQQLGQRVFIETASQPRPDGVMFQSTVTLGAVSARGSWCYKKKTSAHAACQSWYDRLQHHYNSFHPPPTPAVVYSVAADDVQRRVRRHLVDIRLALGGKKVKLLIDDGEGGWYEGFSSVGYPDHQPPQESESEPAPPQFLEGGFNPYGNGQYTLSMRFNSPSTGDQQQVMIGETFGVDRMITGLLLVQYRIAASAAGALAVFGIEALAEGESWCSLSANPLSTGDRRVLAAFPMLASVNSNSIQVLSVPLSFTVPAGKKLWFGYWTSPTAVTDVHLGAAVVDCSTVAVSQSGFDAFNVSWSNSMPVSSTVVSSVPLDVALSRFPRQSAPLWVSELDPGYVEAEVVSTDADACETRGPVDYEVSIAVEKSAVQWDSSTTILEGSFNAYGNGQPQAGPATDAVARMHYVGVPLPGARSSGGHCDPNWDSHVTDDDWMGFTVHALSSLPRASQSWAMEKLDPELSPYPANPSGYVNDDRPRDSGKIPAQPKSGSVQSGQTVTRGSRPLVRVPPSTVEEKAPSIQLTAVARRITGKWTSWADAVDWACGGDAPPSHLVSAAYKAYLSKNSAECADLWIFRAIVDDRRSLPTFQGLSEWSHELKVLQSSRRYVVWQTEQITGVKPRDSTVLATEDMPDTDEDDTPVPVPSEEVSAASASTSDQGPATNEDGINQVSGLQAVAGTDTSDRPINELDGLPMLTLEEMKDSPYMAAFRSVTKPLDEIIIGREPLVNLRSAPPSTSVAYTIDTSDEIKPGYNQYGNQQPFSADDPEGASRARGHNRRMHALNGNTTTPDWNFPSQMSDVQAGKGLESTLMTGSTAEGGRIDPLQLSALQSGIDGRNGSSQGVGPMDLALRGSVATVANTVDVDQHLNHPESVMWPVYVRGNIEQSNDLSPPIMSVDTSRTPRRLGFTATPEFVALCSQVTRSGAARVDQLSRKGFRAREVMNIVADGVVSYGDSLSTCFLKSMLYEATYSWLNDKSSLPLSGEPSKFDSKTALSSVYETQLCYGDIYHNYVGADCGYSQTKLSCAPYFPMLPFGTGNSVGEITFHLSAATVPRGEEAFFVPPELLNLDEGGHPGRNIAMLALLLAPYPFGIHHVKVTTVGASSLTSSELETNPGLGGEYAQPFIPFSCLTSVKGRMALNFVLPYDTASENGNVPTTAELARGLFMPYAGPRSTNSLSANSELGVCYKGANHTGYISHKLSEYLVSWMAPGPDGAYVVNQTVLAGFRNALARHFRRAADLDFCRELSSVLAVRYPVMYACSAEYDEGAWWGTGPGANASQSFFATAPAIHSGSMPFFVSSSDFTLPMLSSQWWNLQATGMAVVDHDGYKDGYDGGYCSQFLDESPFLLKDLVLTCRYYAATAELCYTSFMQSAESWNQRQLNNPLTTVHAAMRSFFLSGETLGSEGRGTSSRGRLLASMMHEAFGVSPARDMFGVSLLETINPPPSGIQYVFGQLEVGSDNPPIPLLPPSVLADVWIQMLLRCQLTAYTPFIASKLGTSGLDPGSGSMKYTISGGRTVCIPDGYQGDTVGFEVFPEFLDSYMFNQRLIFHTVDSSFFFHNGEALHLGNVYPHWRLCQKSVPPDWTVPHVLHPSLLTAKTNCIPICTATGRRISVGTDQANLITMSNILSQANPVVTGGWLLRSAKVIPNVVDMGAGGRKGCPWPTVYTMGNSSPSSETASVPGPTDGTSTSETPLTLDDPTQGSGSA